MEIKQSGVAGCSPNDNTAPHASAALHHMIEARFARSAARARD
jgi:hypothetical protein